MFTMGCHSYSKAYRFTEILHYKDGTTAVHQTKLIRRAPELAVSKVAASGALFSFWNDHNPEIVAVETRYESVDA